MTVTRGKDNVPSWDGSPATWSEYRKAAYMYEETVKWENRYLCGPRLANELTGSAKAAIANKKRGWLSHQDGVAKLLKSLRSVMSEPALPEIANQLKVYFKMLRRRRGEAMSAFCVRHREEYTRTCKALTRVMREQRTLQDQGKTAWHSGRRASKSTQLTSDALSTAGPSSRGGDSVRQQHPQRETEQGEEGDGAQEEEDQTGVDDQDYYEEYWDQWWNDDYWWWWQSEDYDQTSSMGDSDDDEEDFIEILPDVIKGWLLLEKAGLDHMERNLVQSEVRGNFSLQAVENSLRSHFTDDAIKKKDGEAKHAMFGDDEDGGDEPPWEEDESFYEDMTEEAVIMYQQAKDEEQEAWALIQQGRQTLKEARAKQHDVKMGRRYYDFGGKKSGKGHGKSNQGKGFMGRSYGPCARCGKGHDTQYCPQKKKEEAPKNFEAEEQSEFIYGCQVIEERGTAFCWTNLEKDALTTSDVVKAGFGVLDGGATKTMASVAAIECLRSICRERELPGITKVDLSEKPTFGFGNSDRNQCVSTCYFKVPTTEQEMSLKIHALDQGQAPVLISVDSLRKMGALVDFSTDEVIFTKINPKKLVKMARSAAGHQLIPLAADFMEDGVQLSQAVTSLRALVQE